MAKYIGILFGIFSICVGVFLFIIWKEQAIYILKGASPAILILLGLITLSAGILELIDTIRFNKEDNAKS